MSTDDEDIFEGLWVVCLPDLAYVVRGTIAEARDEAAYRSGGYWSVSDAFVQASAPDQTPTTKSQTLVTLKALATSLARSLDAYEMTTDAIEAYIKAPK